MHRLTVNYYHCVLTGAACLPGQWAHSNPERQKQRKERREVEQFEYTVFNYILTVFVSSFITCGGQYKSGLAVQHHIRSHLASLE